MKKTIEECKEIVANEKIGMSFSKCLQYCTPAIEELTDLANKMYYEQSEWISVEDSLPENDGNSQINCIVLDTYNGIVVRPYNEYHKCWDDEDCDDFYCNASGGNITHWQPLPNPPQK